MKALDFPFRFVGGKIATTDNYTRIVRNQIIDSVMTNYQERIMRPDYGADIQSMVFEQSDDLRRKDANVVIMERLSIMVPRAVIESVDIETAPGASNLVYVKIKYRPTSYAGVEDLTIPVPATVSES